MKTNAITSIENIVAKNIKASSDDITEILIYHLDHSIAVVNSRDMAKVYKLNTYTTITFDTPENAEAFFNKFYKENEVSTTHPSQPEDHHYDFGDMGKITLKNVISVTTLYDDNLAILHDGNKITVVKPVTEAEIA